MYSLVVMVISDDNYDITTHDSAKKKLLFNANKVNFRMH